MADDSEFITRLIDFGLSEKEAQVHFHLLKYGAKPLSVLAKHMKTYREDVYRTLVSLIDKGVVARSISSPTVYAALPLETALNVTLTTHKLERQQLEERKRELEELFVALDRSPPVEWCNYRVLSGPKEVEAASRQNVKGTTRDLSSYLWGNVLSVTYESGELDLACDVVRRGARIRLITEISQANLEAARYALDCGIQVRHVEQTSGINFSVRDFKDSFVVVRFDPARYPPQDVSITAFVCESPTYAKQLLFHYELLWEQSVSAAQRIEELLKAGAASDFKG
jgi:sugar-specific transcriptional regulator TrmB